MKALDEGKIPWTLAVNVIATLPMTDHRSFLIYLLENNIRDVNEARKARSRFLNNTIYTIGYEGRTVDQFIQVLKENKIETVIDVRFSVESQYKPEFSGTLLPRELLRAGIQYAHRKEFGVPYEWQNPYKDGAIPFDCLNKFYRWNVTKNTEFKTFINTVKENGKTALLCYERYAAPTRDQKIACHRSILSAMMQETGEFKEVVNL